VAVVAVDPPDEPAPELDEDPEQAVNAATSSSDAASLLIGGPYAQPDRASSYEKGLGQGE
jgi:hypothetical protein